MRMSLPMAAISSLPGGGSRSRRNPSAPDPEESPRMPANDQVNWQPISQKPLIASMIDTSLDDTREHLATLTKARAKPHVLDDATIDRVERVHTEQMEFVATYTQQINRWRGEKPSACPDPRVGSDGYAEPTPARGHRRCPRPSVAP